jgi:hypothetical protein
MSMKTSFKLIPTLLTLAVIASPAACVKKGGEAESDVMWAVSGSSSDEVQSALRAKIAFRLNLKTNRATMYKNGVAVDQWNIATGDVSGAWHNGEPQYTPTGVFNIEDMEICPGWFPRDPVNPRTGRVVSSEQERQRVFAENPQTYGPCGSKNPLGRYALWFNGAYGMHGNSNEAILNFQNPNDRRVSGGCVRNPNAKIQSVFHTVLNTFDSLDAFSSQVTSMEARGLNNRWTLTKKVSSLNMRVVVGHWSFDPAVGSQMGGAPVPPTPAATAKPSQKPDPVIIPTAQPKVEPVVQPIPSTPTSDNTAVKPVPTPVLIPSQMSCKILSVDPSSGVAPVYLNVPGTNSDNRIASFYRLGWPATVLAKVEGTSFLKVSSGYIDQKYVSNCSENF